MGKGDKKSRRGKIVIGSSGVRRQKKKKPTLAASVPKPKSKVKTEEKVKTATKPKTEAKVKSEKKESEGTKKLPKKKVDK